MLWATLIVEELVRNDITHFVLSPGSRNTPLVAAVARHEKATPVMHFDERGAAFLALGQARASGIPAVAICTSGTAAANYLPAVVEASTDRVPLILLTADRPPELRDTGANQTIGQPGLYGKYVRWQHDLACPTKEIAPEVVLTTVDQAVHRARRIPRGPVHVNCMFRELPTMRDQTSDSSGYLATLQPWLDHGSPFTRYATPRFVPDPAVLDDAQGYLDSARRGLVVVGRLSSFEEREAVLDFCRQLNWPVAADIASGLRLGSPGPPFLPYYDLMLYGNAITEIAAPEVILHLGAVPTSKRLLALVRASTPAAYIHVADHPCRCDPEHRVSLRIESGPAAFCSRLAEVARPADLGTMGTDLIHANRLIEEVLAEAVDNAPELTEPATARLISRHISDEACLFLASSMPIRDMDAFARWDGPAVPVCCNRGASGIDGGIATALGCAIGWKRPVTILIGDLALLHDLNSLRLAANAPHSATIVVLNNDGGGIFSFLPVSRETDIFEPFFGTPHGLTFERAAQMFGLDYARPRSAREFVEVYQTVQKSANSTIIEVVTERAENLSLHRALEERVMRALERSW